MRLFTWMQQQEIAPGLLSVYKPYGISSTVVTELYKRGTHEKVGHGGTLDPLAEGLMLLGVGKGTKLLSKYLTATKKYVATIVLGATTESLDLELPLSLPGCSDITETSLRSVVSELESPYEQVVPSFSAAKIGGKSSYDLARKGQEVVEKRIVTQLLTAELANYQQMSAAQFATYLSDRLAEMQQNFKEFTEVAAEISFYTNKSAYLLEKWQKNFEENIELLQKSNAAFYQFDLTVTVPKGTYIRSVAVDIANRLGTIGVLTKLVRINAGS